MIPQFGRGTIHRFASNASEMKKLGARDFEDLLLCAIPAFEGLFDLAEDNRLVLKLLFKMAEWHAYAKLHMHTDDTISHLESLTAELGKLMCHFQDTTYSRMQTFELPHERLAREHRQMVQNQTTISLSATPTSALIPASAPTPIATSIRTASTSHRKQKTLNLNTYKWHSLGDYVHFIKLFGPSDSFSTQIVSNLS